ncbi:MAG: hypothetical protein IJR08_02895 [Bacilli bacterium]|nr:hypothetical protein [Bacilli bacterium]
MDNSNKAIARRINKELKIRGWSQTDLLRSIIKFKNPEISKSELYVEVNRRKGNFSTTLKGNNDRSIPKEDLYIISKIFVLPLEYIWFGDKKKEGFIPNGARYVAYQDNEIEYRSYIADLEYEDKIQYPDQSGFNLFDYFGQFESINGYKFFVKNYALQFDYSQYGELMYVNSEGYLQFCSSNHSEEKEYSVSDNLIMVLAKHEDVRLFKTIFFDNCSLQRFDSDRASSRRKILFSDNFLETLLNNKQFFELILKVREVDVGDFSRYYDKGTKRFFVEPMLYETLDYALRHEEEHKEQLFEMLNFALEFSKKQYEFIKDYLKAHHDKDEHGDVHIDNYAPRFLRSSRNIPMGNVFRLTDKLADDSLNSLLKEIEQCTFNMTHIIKQQEKNNDEIKISTPDNPLFVEMCEKAREQKATFVPMVVHADKEFTYFQNYEATPINFDNREQLQFVINCLDKAQGLVTSKPNKVLVHGDLSNKVLMIENGKNTGIAGWQKCHYGNKFEDRATLLYNIDSYSFRDDYLKKYKELFNVISQDFNHEEKVKMVDKAINILTERRKSITVEGRDSLSRICWLKERASKLELFKELYLTK